MHYLVLDLEWNIPDKVLRQKLIKTYEFEVEIIEIGATLLDKDLQVVSRFFSAIKAQFIKKLNVHVSELTKREEDSLKEGLLFPEAIQKFNAWLEKENVQDYLLCTWSNSDSKPWLSNLKHYGLLPTHIPKVLDVQRLFGHGIEDLSMQKSLAFALEYFGLQSEAELHVASHDAHYTALVFQQLIKHLQEKQRLPKNANALYHDLQRLSFDPTLPTAQKIDFAAFPTLEALEQSIFSYNWPCPACHQVMNENYSKRAWKLKNANRLQKTFRCKEHGKVFVQIRIFKQTHTREKILYTAKAKATIQKPL